MRGDVVTIWLNGELVVDKVVMENYWDYSKPVLARGTIELQHHGSALFFRNIYIKELQQALYRTDRASWSPADEERGQCEDSPNNPPLE